MTSVACIPPIDDSGRMDEGASAQQGSPRTELGWFAAKLEAAIRKMNDEVGSTPTFFFFAKSR